MTLEKMDRVTSQAAGIRAAQKAVVDEQKRLQALNAAPKMQYVKVLLVKGDCYGNGDVWANYLLPTSVLVQQQIYAVMKAERELVTALKGSA